MKNPEKRKPGRPSEGLGTVLQFRIDHELILGIALYMEQEGCTQSEAARDLMRIGIAARGLRRSS